MLIWEAPQGVSGAVRVRLTAAERSRSIAEFEQLGIDTSDAALLEALLTHKALCYALALMTVEANLAQNEVRDLKLQLLEQRKARKRAQKALYSTSKGKGAPQPRKAPVAASGGSQP